MTLKVDQTLETALRRVPAPPSFAERAVARVRLAGARNERIAQMVRFALLLVLLALAASTAFFYASKFFLPSPP